MPMDIQPGSTTHTDDGTIRVTLDMRNPNNAIISTNMPIPRPEYISSQLAGYKVFSKLDFKSAFFQLELDEKSRALTVFHASERLMRFKRLIMGYKLASGELNAALRPLFEKMEHFYVIQDDLMVEREDKKQHDPAMDRVFQVIMESGVKISPSKCLIAKEKIP